MLDARPCRADGCRADDAGRSTVRDAGGGVKGTAPAPASRWRRPGRRSTRSRHHLTRTPLTRRGRASPLRPRERSRETEAVSRRLRGEASVASSAERSRDIGMIVDRRWRGNGTARPDPVSSSSVHAERPDDRDHERLGMHLTMNAVLLLASSLQPPTTLTAPDEVLRGDPIPVRVSGVEPGSRVLVTAERRRRSGLFRSGGLFVADEDGVVDPSTQRPLIGTWTGVDPTGLFSGRSGTAARRVRTTSSRSCTACGSTSARTTSSSTYAT